MSDHAAEESSRPPAARTPVGRVLEWLVVGLNAAGSVWVFLIMLLVCLDVAMRDFFNAPIPGVPLVITMSLISIVFLQSADALRNGRMTRNEALLGRFLRNRPALGYTLQGLFHLGGAAFCALLVHYTWPLYLKAWRSKAYLGTQGDVTLPEWPFKLLIIVGAVVLGLQFLALAWRDLRSLRGRG